MPTLSVAIPAYNEELNLGPCLDRLLAQTHPIDEIIVVNNWSTDRTALIADEYASRHPNVRRVDEEIPGVHHARRRGLDEGASDIIAKVDADTRVPPDWAETGLRFFREIGHDESDFGALTGPILMHDAPRYEKNKRAAQKSFRRLGRGRAIGSVRGPAYFLRRSAWLAIRDDLNDYDPIWEDLDIGLALKKHGYRIFFDPALLADSSCRRFRYAPWRNFRYARGGIATARAHEDRKITTVMMVDLPFKLAVYTYLWLLLRPWDPRTRTWRPHRYFLPLAPHISAEIPPPLRP
ncbi:glycosyltransferase family A protein [Gordonia hongkongensis]|uniref:Glycosyltransferase family 2 protein n=1 Tax=Gordonia hongkongensis TaxID=1701090 RepID=A0AAX3T4V0_9ACTN|nr:glycosyltransferase family A protein [Gordonia hongkongensis]MDF6101204.1 glycosyltransferase family 2 protein [Gordonia hongkongensis]QIK46965.1 glycosyltransferase family 2 protein [Gordonia terrae]UPG67366.1 glycosyltransferase family 2 protein [Gordonia hongkongensis]WFP24012.1 glycosyltransferase family A protein [Gordonia hongkongensis]